jgi:hypothetical protein
MEQLRIAGPLVAVVLNKVREYMKKEDKRKFLLVTA